MYTNCHIGYKLFLYYSFAQKYQYTKTALIRRYSYFCYINEYLEAMKDILVNNLKRSNVYSLLVMFFKWFTYEDINYYSSLALLVANPRITNTYKRVQALAAIYAITIGAKLHYNVDGNVDLGNMFKLLHLWKKFKKGKDKYMVLAGDFMHVLAAVLASYTYKVFVSQIMASIEIAICRYAYFEDKLAKKIYRFGYGSITIEEIHKINMFKASRFVLAMYAVDCLYYHQCIAQAGQYQPARQFSTYVYQCLGLLLLYLKYLYNFQYYARQLLNRFVKKQPNQVGFCGHFTISQYIFYQGYEQRRSESEAYANTLIILKREIALLWDILRSKISQYLFKNIENKLKYMMMHHH